MKLAYFPNQIARNGTEVLESIMIGARQHGITMVADDLEADAAVIWSVLWSGRLAPNKLIYQHYRSRDLPVIVIDVGALHRSHTWKIALNHVNGLGYYGHTENLDPDRPRKLGIQLRNSTDLDPAIILAAQHTGSLQVQDIDLVGWLDEQIKNIRQISDRKLILRPHPRCRMDLQRFQRQGIEIQQPKPVTGTYDSFDLDLAYHAIVNYNSGPGIQAAISGTRPVVHSSSLAWPVAMSLENIENSYDIDRDQWLIEISHTEYTLEEIARGTWITRLHIK